jgi:hypothetical protein
LALATAGFGREGATMVELLKDDGSAGLREFQAEMARALTLAVQSRLARCS